MQVTVYHLVGGALILLAFMLAGPGRLSYAVTRRRRLFGALPARARGALPALVFGAGAGALAVGVWSLPPVQTMAQGALFALIAYYIARLAWVVWPLSLMLVAVVYAPLWHLLDIAARLLDGWIRHGQAVVMTRAQEAFFFHRAYWPNRDGMMDILGYPPPWFAAPALAAVFFAWARARGKR